MNERYSGTVPPWEWGSDVVENLDQYHDKLQALAQ